MKIKTLFIVFLLLIWSAHSMASATKEPSKALKPKHDEKCPVCGMFVAQYTDWVAQIIYKDGTHVYFDGVKDMMKYYFDVKKYHHNRNKEDISEIYVTDYYNVFFFKGYEAYYVIGSDIRGPMGNELIPFKKESEAKEFMSDHKGKKILRFNDITPEVIERL